MSLHWVFSLRKASRSALAAVILASALLNCGPALYPLPLQEIAPTTRRFPLGDGWVLCGSPDGQRLVSVIDQPDGPTRVRLWDRNSGRVLGEDDAPPSGHVRFGIFSPNGRRLAVVERRFLIRPLAITIRIWDVAPDGKLTNVRDLEADVPLAGSEILQTSFSPDGSLVAAGTAAEEVVHVWDAATGELKRRFQGGVTAHFAPDGRTLIAVTHDGEVRRFDTATWKFLGPAQPFKRSDFILVGRAVLAPDGKRIAVSDDSTTLVKDVETNKTLCRMHIPAPLYLVSFSGDGKTLAVAGEHGTYLFDATTGVERAWLKPGDGLGRFIGDGKYLACFGDKTLTLRDIETVFERPETAPSPVSPDPPGVPLEAELVARQNTYTLDLEGDTPEDFSTRIHFGTGYPEPPLVDLVLNLRNTGKENIRLRNLRSGVMLYLVGPGALSRPWELKQVFGSPPKESVSLAPEESCSIPVTSLTAKGFAFWLLPGDYLLGGEYSGEVSPAPPGARFPDNGSGYVSVRFAPIKVKVVAGKHVPDPGPPARAYELQRPPPPGTVIAPSPMPDDRARFTRDMLSQPIKFGGLDPETPLKEALELLTIRCDLDIRIDEAAFQKVGRLQIAETRIKCPELLNITLETVLNVLLDQVDARLELRGQTIWILPAVKQQCLAERLYPARRAFKDQMDEPVDLKGIEGETPLSEALQILRDELELTFVIDVRSFERARVKDIENRPVWLPPRTSVRLRVVLEEVLQQAGATFVLRDRSWQGLVVVIPKEKRSGTP